MRAGACAGTTRRVVAVAIALCALLAGAAAVVRAHARPVDAQARAGSGATYRNPVFTRDFPDPMVLKVGRDYYAYGTTTAWEPLDHEFPILHSRDLVHWRYVGDAMTTTPAWSTGDWWAPDVIARTGTYYLYYVGKSLEGGQHCVAVATATKPTGPFVARAVIGCGDARGQGYIDPAPLIDTDGRAYLYISVDNPYHSISVIPLGRDLLHAAGPRKELFGVSEPWEHGPYFTTVEGPFVVKHGRTYDLFYSGNDWQHNYAMGYATAPSPLGPFRKCACNPILHGNARVTGPGGGSLVQGPHGGWWLIYHAWSGGPGYDAGGVRNLRIDPLHWRGDALSVRGPTTAPASAP
jgi:beta-xylosidase